VVGCGTSYYVALAMAAAREAHGAGESDAFPASEMPAGRAYDRVVAISRSGTTTEVVRLLEELPVGMPSLAISATAGSPVAEIAADAVLLDFADEESVVQTRFATTTLALLRGHLGDDLGTAIADAQEALERPVPKMALAAERHVFLGSGWTVGLAHEAALKYREAAGAWAEAFPAMEYRHGPISLADPATLVWSLGPVEAELLEDVRATGAHVIEGRLDPMAELVMIQRAAVALAEARGLDPDRPRNLSRSVVLS